MGYDLYGKRPTAPEGEHFRRRYDVWPEMLHFCGEFAGEEMSRCAIG